MNKHNISGDKRDAALQLNARKSQITEMIESLNDCGIDISPPILGAMYNDIEEINKLLGVDDE